MVALPWVSNPVAQQILKYVHIIYPIVLLVLYVVAATVRSVRISSSGPSNAASTSPEQLGPGGKPLPRKHSPAQSPANVMLDFSRPRKLLFQWTAVAVILSMLANIVLVVVHALAEQEERWWCGEATTIYLVGSFMVYLLFVVDMLESVPSPTAAHWVSWIVAWIMEVILLGASLALYTTEHREPRADRPRGGDLEKEMTGWEIIEVLLDFVRVFLLAALIGFYALFVFALGPRKGKVAAATEEEEGDAEEHAALLPNANGSAHAGYGTHAAANGAAHGPPGHGHGHGEVPAGWEKPKTTPERTWWEYIRAYGLFLPYIWPTKDRRLQVNFVICIAIVFLQRALVVLVPVQLGNITNALVDRGGPISMPWIPITIYVVYRLFQGGQGMLGAARSLLWIPIGQYSYRELSVASFEHVHQLSLEFHLGKKTGEVLSALSKGDAVNTFLESITFQMVPMLVDLAVAMAYLSVRFDAYYALSIAVVTFWYVYVTIRMASWRQDIRRQAQTASREESAVKNDSLTSYESVKYFNAESYEFDRYRNAVVKYQKAEFSVTFSLAILNTVQNLVFMLGLIVMSFIAAYQVTTKRLQVGDFITLLTYLALLQGPLNFFGTFYRQIQNAMINTERMLELFKEEPTVVDQPDARDMSFCEGEIKYNDVKFSYDDRKPALQGLTFTCKPGTTTAFVGESGGGKSTVFRLLFRFYNQQSGVLQVDGNDVEGVTIDSLRRHIGVVPQDTVLFNETLMYNLRYARQGATDAEVYAACKAASIHDKILTFPDGYDTKVGERGLRLSGGEKQRVAIARTILKDPKIILLDEATAALDTDTEEHIQDALRTLANGRTMLIIAHRLSTITMCDQILVLHDGQVIEAGSHPELLRKGGRYAKMWRKQARAQEAADQAQRFKDKADRLRRESMSQGPARAGVDQDDVPSGSSSEDESAQAVGKAGKLAAATSASSSTTLVPPELANPGPSGPASLQTNTAAIRSPSPVQEEDGERSPRSVVYKPLEKQQNSDDNDERGAEDQKPAGHP